MRPSDSACPIVAFLSTGARRTTRSRSSLPVSFPKKQNNYSLTLLRAVRLASKNILTNSVRKRVQNVFGLFRIL